MSRDTAEEPDWRRTCTRNIDEKFNDPSRIKAWRSNIRRQARPRRLGDAKRDPDTAAIDPDSVINQAYVQITDRLDRAQSPEELGPDWRQWPGDPYIARVLWTILAERERAKEYLNPPDAEPQDDPLAREFSRIYVLQRAYDAVNHVGLEGEVRMQAIFVVRWIIDDLEPNEAVHLPVSFAPHRVWDEALFYAVAHACPPLERIPHDEVAYRKEMYRRKRTLKASLAEFEEQMKDDLP